MATSLKFKDWTCWHLVMQFLDVTFHYFPKYFVRNKIYLGSNQFYAIKGVNGRNLFNRFKI